MHLAVSEWPVWSYTDSIRRVMTTVQRGCEICWCWLHRHRAFWIDLKQKSSTFVSCSLWNWLLLSPGFLQRMCRKEFWFLFGYNGITFSGNLGQDKKRVSTKIQSILRSRSLQTPVTQPTHVFVYSPLLVQRPVNAQESKNPIFKKWFGSCTVLIQLHVPWWSYLILQGEDASSSLKS